MRLVENGIVKGGETYTGKVKERVLLQLFDRKDKLPDFVIGPKTGPGAA